MVFFFQIFFVFCIFITFIVIKDFNIVLFL